MEFLHYLDVGIGFSLGMIVLATLIGTASAVWIALLGTHTRHMRKGLASLLENAGGVAGVEAEELAGALIWDKTVKVEMWSNRFMKWIRQFSAETIQREELALVLLRAAASNDNRAIETLGVRGADEAEALLRAVEDAILVHEARNPELPAQVWRTKALADHARQFSARLFSQFDNVMDRVEDNVKFSGKLWSVVFAAVFLLQYPVNSLEMIQRLSADEPLRRELVEEAKRTQNNELANKVKASGLYGDAFTTAKCVICDKENRRERLPGVILTWVMVSFGAPFWMEVLNKLLGLRSLMERKAVDERGRRDRDLTRESPPSPPK